MWQGVGNIDGACVTAFAGVNLEVTDYFDALDQDRRSATSIKSKPVGGMAHPSVVSRVSYTPSRRGSRIDKDRLLAFVHSSKEVFRLSE